MRYKDNQFISVKFLKENDLIANESVFFKTIPQRYKLKVVDKKLFTKLESIKEAIENINDEDMEISNWLVPSTDVEFETILNFKESADGDYLDFISMDFYKSMKWVGYSKRTKLGEQQ